MTDRFRSGGTDAEADGRSSDVRRWSNRPEVAPEDDFTRGGGSSRPTPPRPEPSRNPERDWGVVLATAGIVVILLAGGVLFSLLMGGILGILSARAAVVLTVLLVVAGSAGLFQGWRVYHGR